MSRSSRPVQTPNAEEDEKTQVLKPGNAGLGRTGTQPSRQAGLPPPLIGAALPMPEAKAPAADASDDEPTRVMSGHEHAAEQAWLVSDGHSAPRELSQGELLAELLAGSVSATAFAWQKGMKEWHKVTDISSLAGAFKERSALHSSRPPKRTSSPKASSTIPTDRRDTPKLGRSVPLATISPFGDSRRETPKLGASSILLNHSAPTADAAAVAESPRAASPDQTPSKPHGSTTPGAGGANESEKAFSVPRPAAGRKPSPDEPIAKTEPLLGAPTPSVMILETGAPQTLLRTNTIKHREVTEPARSRLALAQLYAASRPPNIVLWLLGAGGWAVAGVLAGLLIARGNHRTPLAIPVPAQAAPAPKQTVVSPRAVAPAEPVPSFAKEQEVTPLAQALPVPVPEPAPPSSPVTQPRTTGPAPPRAATTTATPTMPAGSGTPAAPAAARAAPQPEPSPADDLNSPGF